MTRKSGNKSKYYFKRLQKFQLIAVGIFTLEALSIVVVSMLAPPVGFPPSIVVLLWVLGLSLLGYLIIGACFLIPLFAAIREEGKRRRAGLSVDSTDPGPWLN